MRARQAIIIAATWLIASAVFSPRACTAGFLRAHDACQYLLEDRGASAPDSQNFPAEEPGRGNLPILLASVQVPVLGNVGSTSSPGTMLRLTSSGAFAALPSRDEARSLPETQRLQIEESTLLPAVHLSRVFRPPRV